MVRTMAASLGVPVNGMLAPWTLLAVGSGFTIFAGGKCYFCPTVVKSSDCLVC